MLDFLLNFKLGGCYMSSFYQLSFFQIHGLCQYLVLLPYTFSRFLILYFSNCLLQYSGYDLCWTGELPLLHHWISPLFFVLFYWQDQVLRKQNESTIHRKTIEYIWSIFVNKITMAPKKSSRTIHTCGQSLVPRIIRLFLSFSVPGCLPNFIHGPPGSISCYLFSKKVHTWNKADRRCKRFKTLPGRTVSLVRIETAIEDAFILGELIFFTVWSKLFKYQMFIHAV